MRRLPQEMQSQIEGLLPFVCTPFGLDGEIDPGLLREHLQYLTNGLPDRPTCHFVCCGTGEFWSLDLAEYQSVVKAAVEEVGRQVPILAGVGYGTRLAIQFAAAAEEEGADGILVFPPYLISAPQEGLYQHYRAVAKSTRLAVTIYNRDNAIFEPRTVARLIEECPNIIGLKDGYGDMKLLAEIRRLVGDAFVLMNGMPSAEMFAPAWYAAGIRPYSPGVIDFVPEIAWAFYHAIERGDDARLARLTEVFYHPYTELRKKVPGYGIALVKAGLKLRGKPVGGVRSPLVSPSAEDEAQLQALIERGLSLLS